MQKEHNSPRVHYAWVICGACTLMLFVAMGLNSNVFTVYQPYILSRYGFSNTQCSLLIGRWFHARRGLAFGIGTTGSGIATIIMPPLITALIEQRSLSFAFYTEAAITALTSLLILLLIRGRPEELGLRPYTTGEETKALSSPPPRRLHALCWCRAPISKTRPRRAGEPFLLLFHFPDYLKRGRRMNRRPLSYSIRRPYFA